MKNRILLTGGTGFLGSWVARTLLRETECEIIAIVRGKTQVDAERRASRLWSDWPEMMRETGSRVRIVQGDLCRPDLGLEPGIYRSLVTSITHVIHSAAELDLDGPIDELRRVNVGGTAGLLALAGAAHRDHGLSRFAHVSTAYVAGRRTGDVAEEDFADCHGFANNYERTKYEGELLVRTARADLPVTIFRPGMVVGDSESGEIQTFNTVYVPLRLYLSGKLTIIPARPNMGLNLVPVDYVARAIARLTFHQEAVGRTFHLTVDSKRLPSARALLDLANRWGAVHLGQQLPAARFLPFKNLDRLASHRIPGLPACLLSYFNEERRYLRTNVDRLLGPYEPDWEAIVPRLLDYAVRRGFLRHSGRTVHEQMVHRLQSRNLPLRVHDLSEGKPSRPRSGADMCREIRLAANALQHLGIEAGDRVAIVGLNSSRFLSLDTAIGLCGAVSVPLYYTAPVAEIEQIIRISGTRLLLVGAPALLERMGEFGSAAQIVTFCASPLPPDLAGQILPWESFLELGEKGTTDTTPLGRGDSNRTSRLSVPAARYTPTAPVGFPDLATLRFTSGTTGSPKGVTFRHGQLLWLAEVLASILPWKARISPARYLSFLPMNHVVEGILGTYAPSYMPAAVDIFFLQDFHALSRVLPQVRPTVFFAVPRFYEKVWNRFTESGAGRRYLLLPTYGPGKALRSAFRPLLRALLLRRAGLDRCAQLIAGSAPCPEDLLASFRELGIEIHNAYGLTEAPLVTLNRHGENRLGTVGKPLSHTDVRIADDGEVQVRGPQVTGGYFESSSESIFIDDWLCTGDLGELGADGYLTIRGRKKEILITSYGKNIHPGKIENMLRRIPGMAEVMVIGDNRPTLSALLWLKESQLTPAVIQKIDESVRSVNESLSHPEQVRRWVILADKPAIENGELTGNLKLRRQVVVARRVPVVEMLYGPNPREVRDDQPVPGVLHVGESQCA